MPCFPGTTLACLIANYFHRLYRCSTNFCLSPISLHTLCILIGLQLPPDKCFPPIQIPKELLKSSARGTDTTINVPVTPRDYVIWPNIVDDIGFMNLSMMSPLVFPRALSTVVTNNVSKLSIINTSWGVLSQLSIYCSLGENNWCRLDACPSHYFYVFGIHVFCGIGGL